MASMESMLRNINRQLEQHARTFGTDSNIYKDLVHAIERKMGKANYTQRNGAVGYSRSIPMQYKFDEVKAANDLVKGAGTASMKWNKWYKDAKELNIDDKDINRFIRLSQEVRKNQEAIYNYLKQEMGDAFYSSEYVKGYHNSFKDSDIQHLMKTTNYTTLEEVEKLIRQAKAKAEKIKEEIEREAQKTKGGKMTKKEAEQFIKRFAGRRKGKSNG